jgi:hypothetical protein
LACRRSEIRRSDPLPFFLTFSLYSTAFVLLGMPSNNGGSNKLV